MADARCRWPMYNTPEHRGRRVSLGSYAPTSQVRRRARPSRSAIAVRAYGYALASCTASLNAVTWAQDVRGSSADGSVQPGWRWDLTPVTALAISVACPASREGGRRFYALRTTLMVARPATLGGALQHS
eukprot:1933052-Prymnesium_polylepis.1